MKMDFVERNQSIQRKIDPEKGFITLADYCKAVSEGKYNRNLYNTLWGSCEAGIIWNCQKKIKTGTWTIKKIQGFDVEDAVSLKKLSKITRCPLVRIYRAFHKGDLKVSGSKKHYFVLKKEAVPVVKQLHKQRYRRLLRINREDLIVFFKEWKDNEKYTVKTISELTGMNEQSLYKTIHAGYITYELTGTRYSISKRNFLKWVNSKLDKPIAGV